jgi:hypothetical protein
MDILFRGKRIDNGEWHYGDLVHKPRHRFDSGIRCFIRLACGPNNGEHEVRPETVCQYIGRLDRNDEMIYSGDFVLANWYDSDGKIRIHTQGYILYDEDTCSYVIMDNWHQMVSRIEDYDHFEWNIEVTGNIIDNPELIGE